MQMNVSLTPELHEIVQQKVRSGLYSNASEVIRDSIRNLDKDNKKENAWNSLNNLLDEAANSGRSTNSIDDIIKNSIKKNG
ncbi:type II toxin-antitoxin system ParD family antitoxin [Lentisphaera profundi]|uniref:Type II toxin-antitoxin system ParD family antitoxin n=1 Tax=Lentisphaera profundi TaxID=1658616 RepID=A0ABY7VNB1_9BACT|nr:type II toxin-antitoxin system ParD family antitoxin [Lentisphaera profundi]WDE95586.1 type II toxin-antitoxin system ParD family antitoxin [Lentisphaera profundi]